MTEKCFTKSWESNPGPFEFETSAFSTGPTWHVHDSHLHPKTLSVYDSIIPIIALNIEHRAHLQPRLQC